MNTQKNSIELSCNGPPRPSPNLIPILKLRLNWIKTETSKY